jgi:HEAT repeats
MLFPVGIFSATVDDSPLTVPLPNQRLAYSELVCSATIVDNQLTGRTMNFGFLTAAENLARADVDTVFKGKLTTSIVTFRWYSWPAPEDPNVSPHGYAYSGPSLANLRPRTRYLLFLRSEGEDRWRVAVPVYQLEVLLAPRPDASLSPHYDSSSLIERERNLELAQEFANAARFIEPLGDAGDVSVYFDWIDQLLGKDAGPFIIPFLGSATIRLRFFAADKLAQMKNDAGTSVLLASLKSLDLDAINRARAASDLGTLHAREALPDLEKFATDDPKSAVREGALRGLGELGDLSSVRALVRALDDPVDTNRIYAASILEKIMFGETYNLDIMKSHEGEIITSWKSWLAGNSPPPNYSRYLR